MNSPHFARRLRLASCLGTVLGTVFAATAGAQQVLPFPPTPSASKAGLTIETSTYQKRVEPKHLADGAPEPAQRHREDRQGERQSKQEPHQRRAPRPGVTHQPALQRVARHLQRRGGRCQ